MRIAVLYDGDGKARLALEAAGHDCVGFEPDADKHLECCKVGSGRCVKADPKDADLDAFDGIWVNGSLDFDIEIRPLWINGEEIK